MYDNDRSRNPASDSGYDSKRFEGNRRSPPIRDRSPRYRSNYGDSEIQQRIYDDYVTNDYRSRRYEQDTDDYRTRRHRDRRRSRSRSRSRERSSHDSREPSRDRRSSREGSRERRRREEDDDYMRRRTDHDPYRDPHRRDEDSGRHDTQPTSTVIVQNLGTEATESKIEDHLRLAGVKAISVQVIRERSSGVSKGFAFVEFPDVATAEKWIQVTKRNIVVDGRSAQLDFSHSRKSAADPHDKLADWNCAECNALNFGSRKKVGYPVICFKCGKEAKDTDGDSSSSVTDKYDKDIRAIGGVLKLDPCNVLMLRGMSFSTTEEEIRVAVAKLTTHPIYDVRLICDKVTDMSRGFAFVEFGCSEHATELLEKIEKSDPPFEIEMRKITVGYAKHGYNAPITQSKDKEKALSNKTAATNAVAQATAAQGSSEYSQCVADTTYSSYTTTGTTTSKYYDTQTFDQSAYSQAYSGYGSSTYDPTTGYYYDASTGLYYDPSSGYYYNGNTGQFLYWDGTRYQAINQDGSLSSQQQQTQQYPAPSQIPAPPPDPKNVENDKDKVNVSVLKPKNARKIAKDMERWAKKMNNATEARKIAVKQAQDELKALEQKEEELRKKIIEGKQVTGVLGQVAKSKESIRSLFVPDDDDDEGYGSLKLGSALITPRDKPTRNIVANDLLDDDDDYVDEAKLVDTTKMACLLCKRQFPNKDVLTKHLSVSALHQTNLAKYKKHASVLDSKEMYSY